MLILRINKRKKAGLTLYQLWLFCGERNRETENVFKATLWYYGVAGLWAHTDRSNCASPLFPARNHRKSCALPTSQDPSVCFCWTWMWIPKSTEVNSEILFQSSAPSDTRIVYRMTLRQAFLNTGIFQNKSIYEQQLGRTESNFTPNLKYPASVHSLITLK